MNNNPLIDLETARALVARGWSVVPTESDAEKRPKGRFASAKSWRDFSDRLPTDAELLGRFGPKPRRGRSHAARWGQRALPAQGT